MPEKGPLGFRPPQEEPLSRDDLIVVGDLSDFKDSLYQALEEIQKREPSMRVDVDIDMLRELIDRVETAESFQNLLTAFFESGLVIPDKIGEVKERRPLGFQVPDHQQGS